jgi:anaerobic magnesium-protoporphyrin IX monomethyl ester cyclase
MLSILVCHSFFLRFDQKQRQRAKPYPPLATLQVASMLGRLGHAVELFDATLAEGTGDYERRLEAIRPQLVLLYEDNFNFLSKMCLGKMRDAACRMTAAARAIGARVIASGSDANDAPEPYLLAGADLVLRGEGLTALVQVLGRLEQQPQAPPADLAAGISGIVLRDASGQPATTGAAPMPTEECADLPAWHLVEIERYRSVWLEAHGYFSLNMATSRGCSFRCAWCAKPIWGNRYLQRAAADVAGEMAYLKHTFAPDHIWFADDIFGFRHHWVSQFAQAAAQARGSIPFTIQTRADLVSEPMAHALAEAGCREAWIGAESGSQRVLDSMNKGTRVEEIITARARLKRAGIRVGFFIQLGYLDEELSDILATRQLIDAARPDDVGVSVSYPLPGTRFYERVKTQLGSKTRWRESDDLEMMFQGTYSTEFYRAVRNLLHDQVSLEQLEGAGHAAEYGRGKRLLEERWQRLLALESEHRRSAAAPAMRLRRL